MIKLVLLPLAFLCCLAGGWIVSEKYSFLKTRGNFNLEAKDIVFTDFSNQSRTITIIPTVANLGSDPVPRGKYGVKVEVNGKTIWKDSSGSEISASSFVTYSGIELQLDQGKEYKIEFIVDYRNQLLELDETNNSIEEKLLAADYFSE